LPKPAKDILEESITLPESTKQALIEDLLLDLVLSEPELQSVESQQDAVLLVNSLVKKFTNMTLDSSISQVTERIMHEVYLFLKSHPLDEKSGIAKHMNVKANNNEGEIKPFSLHNDILCVYIPDINNDNEGLVKNLSFVLSFACRCLNIDQGNLRILRNPKLGGDFKLPAITQSTMELFQAALSLPASQAGDSLIYGPGLKANIPELMACLKVIRRNSNLVRPLTKSKKDQIAPVTAEIVRRTFNVRFGLDHKDQSKWLSSLLKHIFSEMSKPTSQRLPGEWMNSLKARNGTKSDLGLLSKMGWQPIIVNTYKTYVVLNNKATTFVKVIKPKQKKGETVIGQGTPTNVTEVRSTSDKENPASLDFRDHRAAVVSLLPYINPKAPKGVKDQLSGIELKPPSLESLRYWKHNKEIADATNLAFAFKVSLGKKDTKSTIEHYTNARNHLISLCANKVYQDSTGTTYPAIKDLPENVREWFKKSYHYVDDKSKPVDKAGSDSKVQVSKKPTPQPSSKEVDNTPSLHNIEVKVDSTEEDIFPRDKKHFDQKTGMPLRVAWSSFSQSKQELWIDTVTPLIFGGGLLAAHRKEQLIASDKPQELLHSWFIEIETKKDIPYYLFPEKEETVIERALFKESIVITSVNGATRAVQVSSI
jgi:hypothetical protein